MANHAEALDILTRYAKARIPFVSLRTAEQARGLELLRAVASDVGLSMTVHTLSQGLRDIGTGYVLSDDRSVVGALDTANSQMAVRQNLTFVFTDVQDLDSDTPTARHFLDAVRLAERSGGSILVLSTQPVWSPLQRLGMSVTVDPPDQDEMERILRAMIDPYRSNERTRIEWADEEFSRAASMLVGITQIEAENVVASLLASGSLLKSDLVHVAHAKDQIFSDISGVEKVPVRENLTVGGLQGLHAWLERERPFLTADLRDRDMRPPRGVLLVGVPGCGKSMSAKSIAATWQLPLYRLDLANIQGKFVGESESRLREALATADHLAPCVLWVDEIEKGLAGAGGDSSGVTTRLVGHFLYWLQESQARVFVVATANDVRRLPQELLRRGRFDELFFVDLPDATERREIIDIYLGRYVRRAVCESLAAELVDASEGFSGADIESAVRYVGKEGIRVGDSAISDGFIRACFHNVVPLSRTNPEAIDEIRTWGRERAVPASQRATQTDPGQSQAFSRRVLIS